MRSKTRIIWHPGVKKRGSFNQQEMVRGSNTEGMTLKGQENCYLDCQPLVIKAHGRNVYGSETSQVAEQPCHVLLSGERKCLTFSKANGQETKQLVHVSFIHPCAHSSTHQTFPEGLPGDRFCMRCYSSRWNTEIKKPKSLPWGAQRVVGGDVCVHR